MISFERAQKLIEKNVPAPTKVEISVDDSLCYVLAEDMKAPFALPLYDNSAMDGYVLRSRDTRFASPDKPVWLKIKGAIRTGDCPARPLRANETFKIMTGALIPSGGDSVLLKEEASVWNGCLIIEKPVETGQHIRKKGEEIKEGERVISNGTIVCPATVGVLASLGFKRIKVFRRPKVSVMTTGSELIPAGRKLKRGKIYDSNSLVVSSALKGMGIKPVLVRTIGDRRAILKRTFWRAIKISDVVILTGGVSVGDYDYVKEVLAELGVRAIFWKVSQKPGKPIYFGKKGSKLAFGLPGNPASVFTCFYEHVFPALRGLCGFKEVHLASKTACLQTDVKADRSRHLFLKGRLSFSPNGGEVTPLRHQASHMISSLCNANCFISVPPRSGVLRKGAKVEAHLLPYDGGSIE